MTKLLLTGTIDGRTAHEAANRVEGVLLEFALFTDVVPDVRACRLRFLPLQQPRRRRRRRRPLRVRFTKRPKGIKENILITAQLFLVSINVTFALRK